MLEWDSQFFGFPVAKISALAELEDLRAKGVKLVYWATPNPESQVLATTAGGVLVDKKVTYQMDLSTIPGDQLQFGIVTEYRTLVASEELLQLAIQAGAYSRFHVDPQMDQQKFQDLYKQWMEKSCRHEIAQAVLVIQEHDHCVAVATVGEKHGHGDIGLVAVDAEQRGKGYGLALIRAAQTWFVQHKYTTSQVVTQGDNVAACKLYEKCGYQAVSLEYYYHFWL